MRRRDRRTGREGRKMGRERELEGQGRGSGALSNAIFIKQTITLKTNSSPNPKCHMMLFYIVCQVVVMMKHLT